MTRWLVPYPCCYWSHARRVNNARAIDSVYESATIEPNDKGEALRTRPVGPDHMQLKSSEIAMYFKVNISFAGHPNARKRRSRRGLRFLVQGKEQR